MASVWSWLADWLVDWNFALQVLTLGVTALTIALGGLTIVAGKIAGDRTDARLAETQKSAETARTNTEAIKQDNLKLALELEAERVRRLELQKSLEPRRNLLAVEVRAKLAGVFQTLPQRSVVIQVASGLPDAVDFGNAILAIAQPFGCADFQLDELGAATDHLRGVQVLHTGTYTDPDPAAKAISDALIGAGVSDVSLNSRKSLSPDDSETETRVVIRVFGK